MERRWARALTLDEMLAIKLEVRTSAGVTDAFVRTLRKVFDIALHDLGTCWNAEEQIKPWDFAIAESQWGEIVGWLCEQVDGSLDLTKANVLLDWMNKGPSAMIGVA